MKVRLEPDHPLTDVACREATGRTIAEWMAYLDAWGAQGKGRRAISDHVFVELKVDAWWVATLNVAYEAASGQTEKDGRPKGYCICCTKTIEAPIDEVYAAWTDLAHLTRWFGATHLEVTEGGALRDADGNTGVFKRIRPNKDLRFEWKGASGDSSLVDMTLTDKGGGKTGVLVNHDRIQTRAEADGLRAAWGDALTTLKTQLEVSK